jgi:hypothetical protein
LFIVKPEMQLTEIPMSTRLFLGLKNACGKETLCECAEALSEDTLRGNGIGPVTIAEFKRLCYKAHIPWPRRNMARPRPRCWRSCRPWPAAAIL